MGLLAECPPSMCPLRSGIWRALKQRYARLPPPVLSAAASRSHSQSSAAVTLFPPASSAAASRRHPQAATRAMAAWWERLPPAGYIAAADGACVHVLPAPHPRVRRGAVPTPRGCVHHVGVGEDGHTSAASPQGSAAAHPAVVPPAPAHDAAVRRAMPAHAAPLRWRW